MESILKQNGLDFYRDRNGDICVITKKGESYSTLCKLRELFKNAKFKAYLGVIVISK